jgi:hypothetical protein
MNKKYTHQSKCKVGMVKLWNNHSVNFNTHGRKVWIYQWVNQSKKDRQYNDQNQNKSNNYWILLCSLGRDMQKYTHFNLYLFYYYFQHNCKDSHVCKMISEYVYFDVNIDDTMACFSHYLNKKHVHSRTSDDGRTVILITIDMYLFWVIISQK